MTQPNILALMKDAPVVWKTLGEAVLIKRGKRLVKSQLSDNGKYAVYQNSMVPLGFYNDGNVKADTTFIICAGAAGEIGYSSTDFWAADDVHYFVVPDSVSSKFLYHFLLSQKAKILSWVRRASIPRLSKSSIERLEIPIPPLAIQQEIVRILDTMTAVTSELTSELNARKKQYEYYCDLLLSFPREKEGVRA